MSKTCGPRKRMSPGTTSSHTSKSSRPTQQAHYSHLTKSPRKRKHIPHPQQNATLTNTHRPSLDFTMCNPPFYSSQEEMLSSAETKSQVPFSACTGAAVEMIAPGGEVEFVSRMIDESLHLRDRVQWYTSMLGKLSSVTALVELLIKHSNHNYAVTEFVQGSKTKRWAVAWSWGDRRPAMVRRLPSPPYWE